MPLPTTVPVATSVMDWVAGGTAVPMTAVLTWMVVKVNSLCRKVDKMNGAVSKAQIDIAAREIVCNERHKDGKPVE